MVQGLLATPDEDLTDDEQVLVDHMQIRFSQLGEICDRVSTKITDLEERGHELRTEQPAQDTPDEADPESATAELEVLEHAGKVIETIANQAKTLTDLYTEVSVKVEQGDLTPADAAVTIQSIEAEIVWLGEIDTGLDTVAATE